MSSDDVLRETFSEVGRGFGYDNVNAEFAAFKEFKVRWQRSYKCADFKVSDYMMDAPREAVEALAGTLFSKISGKGEEPSYPREMRDYVTDPDFARFKQPIYLRRARNLTRDPRGEVRDLEESVGRLEDQGLLVRDPQVCLTWTKEPNVRRVGYCSVLMKVVAVSKIFDTEMIPEFVLDYVVYHEFCHLMLGFDPHGKGHGPEFRALGERYPRRKEAEDWLNRLCLYL